jgi:DNA polymerase III delta prime subunit
MQKQTDAFLFVEKFRPGKIEDCILPKAIKEQVKEFTSTGQIPHLLLSGGAGTGKTTLGRAIVNEIGADLLFMNFSNENGIDTIRNKIVQFASTASFEGNLKVIIGDESDYLTPAAQASLRGIMEEFHKTTRFILTCNFKNRIIDPIHSRCTFIDYKIPEAEKKDLLAQMMKRCVEILRSENIEFEPKAIATLVQKNFPDFRKTLNELQRYSTYGKIDSGVLVTEATSYDDLVASMKAKKFAEVRKWIGKNSDIDPAQLFRYFYDNLEMFDGPSMLEAIFILGEAQKAAAIVVDQEINNMQCVSELMKAVKWK